jgi:multidrug resistance efflux pump
MRTEEAHSASELSLEGDKQFGQPTNLAFIDRSAWIRLSRPADEAEFLSGWLALQCRTASSVQVGVLILGEPDSGQFAPAAFWPERAQASPLIGQAANSAIKRRQGVVLRDPDASGSASRVAIAYPFLFDDQLHGLVAVETLGGGDIELQVTMRQLQWGSTWIEAFVRRKQALADRRAIDQLKIVLDTTTISLEHSGFGAAALAATTHLARALDCNRVSFGLRHNRRSRIVAVSETAGLADRSALVAALAAAADEALDQRTMIVSPPADPNVLCLDYAHRTLARLDGAARGEIITVPVAEPDGASGALIFEFAEPPSPRECRIDLVNSIAVVVGPALLRAYAEERPLPAKLATAARRRLVGSSNPALIRRLAIAAAALAAAVFLAAFQIVFAVPGDAHLEGLVQRTAAAPFNGFLAEALVRPGDRVAADAVLARLEKRDLELEQHAWLMRREQFLKEQQRALSEHKLAAARVLEAQLQEAGAQIALLDVKISRSTIRAPFDAIVIDGDHSQAVGRSVQQGEPLFTLAPLDSFRIVIEVDERDIAYVEVAQKGRLLLAAMPSADLPFTVTKVSPVTVATKGRNAFRVEAALDTTTIALQPGMEGVAKIDTSKQLAVWIWTRRLIDWIRLQLWMLWP